MNEQEILTQLRKAAEEIEIPETLKPEQIEKQLQEQKAKQQQENQHLEPKKSKKIIPWRRLGSMVAVLALVVCSGIYITVTRFDKNSGTGQTDSVAMTDTQQTVGKAGETPPPFASHALRRLSNYNITMAAGPRELRYRSMIPEMLFNKLASKSRHNWPRPSLTINS